MSDLVLTEKRPNKVFLVTLNRPDKLNAISADMVASLTKAWKQAEALAKNNEIHSVIVNSSTPKAFCAGADLKERSALSESEVVDTLKRQRLMMDSLCDLPIPTIAAIEGLAFGGGLELALCCDLRVATGSAQMGLVEGKLAIIPGAGGTQRLARLIGVSRAKELIFCARKFSANEALSMGLINHVADSPLEKALSLCDEMSQVGPLALRAAKQSIQFGIERSQLSDALDWELQCYNTVLKSEDRLEGLRAFLEKRTPVYVGK